MAGVLQGEYITITRDGVRYGAVTFSGTGVHSFAVTDAFGALVASIADTNAGFVVTTGTGRVPLVTEAATWHDAITAAGFSEFDLCLA